MLPVREADPRVARTRLFLVSSLALTMAGIGASLRANTAGDLQRVFFDPIDGGQCLGLAFSRNPMQTIDAAGNVVFWANLDSNGTSDRLVLGLTDGNLLIAARRGDPRAGEPQAAMSGRDLHRFAIRETGYRAMDSHLEEQWLENQRP